jgi:hypothetical protein
MVVFGWGVRVAIVSILASTWMAGVPSPASGGPATASASCSWQFKFPPNGPYGNHNYLWGVSMISATDAWAVGDTVPSDGATTSPLFLHWDGVSWVQVDSSVQDSVVPLAVDALASDDVWAVGRSFSFERGFRPVAVHWDGTGWHASRVPASGTEGQLLGVKAVGPNDVWAVGWRGNGLNETATYAVHWDGVSWNPVSTVDVGTEQELESVSAASPTDIWAVGWSSGYRPLIEHWDGVRWTRVRSDDQTSDVQLTGVSAIAPDDAWAVGTLGEGLGSAYAERWNGSGWVRVDGPTAEYGLSGVSAATTDDVVMVGNDINPGLILTEHWDGTALRLEEVDGYGADEMPLQAVDMLPSGQGFAVGFYYSDDGHYYTTSYLGSC